MSRRSRRVARVLLVALLALTLGAVGGWALAGLTRAAPVAVSTRPLPAGNPGAPTTPVPDDPRPFLGTDLTYVPTQIFSAGTVWSLEVPEGWERERANVGIRWVLPGSPDGTYSVRATPTAGSSSTAEMARSRLAALLASEGEGGLSDVEPVEVTDDTLTVTYVQGGRWRYQHTQFLPAGPTASTAVFEVSSSGRLGDRAGLDALAEHVIASVSRS